MAIANPYALLKGGAQFGSGPEAPKDESKSLAQRICRTLLKLSPCLEAPNQSSNSRIFKPIQQTWKLLWQQAVRLVFTVALLVGLILALKIYQDKGTVAHDGKISFNVVITVLGLALGLNFLVRTP